MKICINPGHCPGYDSGAVHPTRGTQETLVALDVAKKLQEYLISAGVEVVGFIQSDSLAEICEVANNSGADIFLSLHLNAFNGVAKGVEQCISSFGGKSEQLGQCIHNQMLDAFPTLVDRGLKERSGLYVLRNTDMPAVLTEMCFVDNDDDEELITNNIDGFAAAIARGITDFEQQYFS